MKKKTLEVIRWENLKVGDFIEDSQSRLFCFTIDRGGPSCLGKNKKLRWKYPGYSGQARSDYVRMKPTKSFIKLCERLLNLNLKEKQVNNLDYIESLSILKKYER